MQVFKIKLLMYCSLFILIWSSGCKTGGNLAEETDDNVLKRVLFLDNTDTLSFPIVEDFNKLAPIFNQNNDTTYVINFWATWCAPCVEEFPYFEQLAEEMKGEAVEVIMVSLDFDRDIRTKLPKFIKERSVTLPVVSLADPSPNIWIDQVDPEWEGSIPITIVYHNDKRNFTTEAFHSYQELLEVVKQVRY